MLVWIGCPSAEEVVGPQFEFVVVVARSPASFFDSIFVVDLVGWFNFPRIGSKQPNKWRIRVVHHDESCSQVLSFRQIRRSCANKQYGTEQQDTARKRCTVRYVVPNGLVLILQSAVVCCPAQLPYCLCLFVFLSFTNLPASYLWNESTEQPKTTQRSAIHLSRTQSIPFPGTPLFPPNFTLATASACLYIFPAFTVVP